MKLVVVTDPMCSWCWGMTADVEAARAELRTQVEFDVLLGGINTHGTQPIGEYGKNRIYSLWRDVSATTGQTFGTSLPDEYIHNSTPCCLAVESVRHHLDTAPFDYLHDLQERFHVRGDDITKPSYLRERACAHGVPGDVFDALFPSLALRERVRFQFEAARSFGTNALPSMLYEVDGKTRLLAGGYVSADLLVELALEKARDGGPEPVHIN